MDVSRVLSHIHSQGAPAPQPGGLANTADEPKSESIVHDRRYGDRRTLPNRADNRLQIFFEEKPDGETRSALKSNGFRWAPSAGAWQRQLNDNAIYAAGRVACIRPLTGESPSELQKRVRLEWQADAGGFEPVSEENSQEEPDQENEMRMG